MVIIMSAKYWFIWDAEKDRFVRSKRPRLNPELARALQRQLIIRIAKTDDLRSFLIFVVKLFKLSRIFGFQRNST